MESKTILSLYDFSGEWSKPYREAGYNVVQLDLQFGDDIRLMKLPDYPIHGILAAPPCTHFSLSGARYWKGKGNSALLEGLSTIDATLRIVYAVKPQWWAMENPKGRLVHYIGQPAFKFDPCDFGDPWTKKTYLWGNFTLPTTSWVEPISGSIMQSKISNKILRSKTPSGFAQAFYKANP